MQVNDTITLDGVRRTADGYLVASAKVARTGIQIYGGAEVGRPDLPRVRIFRPEAEVFSKDTLASFAHRPVTLDHPSSMVSAANWKALAKGWTDGEIARDGECVRISMLIADQATIDAIEGGKRELSMGYTTDLKWEAGVTPTGEAYDAIQTSIRANHLAVVAAARGGSQLRIGDSIGETVMSDGTTKLTFSDGTSALNVDGRTVYLDVAGNPARIFSAAQMAHMTGQTGTHPMAASDRAYDQMADATSTAWQPTKAGELAFPQSVIDAMTSDQCSAILPALALVNQSTGSFRHHAIAQLRGAARKVTQSSPGVVADGAANQRVAAAVDALCDHASGF